ncbi:MULTISPECIES: hypothetical protein [Streptomyces]|uniref:hypothetical protein n=1 Tax=Streptomyces TaxID=1883 RepID=UPI0005B7733A|nr:MULTISPECIES: hypothetical protein [unclassified Streptomyces]MCM1948486.1 hypothetical protein [Streptomyces sp. G2]
MPTARFLLWGGLVTAAGGAVLCVLGWYGISGERFAERQLPYLASCTVPGAALLVAGAVLVAAAVRTAPTAPDEPGDAAADLAADGTGPPPPPSSDGPPLRVPGGTLAHRPDCPLVADRADALPAAGDPALAPCPVCEPWPP